MLKLVVIDLTAADIKLYEQYERRVVPLMGQYGGRVDLSVRACDARTETHVLYFPDAAAFEQFLADPVRASLQEQWLLTGVSTTITDVDSIDYQ